MSTRRLCSHFTSRKMQPYQYLLTRSMATARTISENNHEKILRYVMRKEFKSLKSKVILDNKSMRYTELRELMTVKRQFIITDTPGTTEIEMHRFMETETLMVKFSKDEPAFEVRVSKVKEGVDSSPSYFVFTYEKEDAMQLSGHYYSYEVDEAGERRNFAARYNGIPEWILTDAEAYLKKRGIDKKLAEFIRIEGEIKHRRERARTLKGLISFLKKKEENGDDLSEKQLSEKQS